MITRIGHLALNPLNMEKSLEFYCGTLGFKRAFELYHDNGDPWIVYLKISDGQFLELFYGGIMDREYAYDMNQTGYNYLGIETADVGYLSATLKKLGVSEPLSVEQKSDLTRRMRIHDPDGNLIEFVDYGGAEIRQQDLFEYGGITTLSLTVAGMEASLQFYCNTLGFEFLTTVRGSENEPLYNILKVAPKVFMELRFGGQGTNPAPVSVWNARGFQHVCLETTDLVSDLEHLRKLGVEVDQEIKRAADKNLQAWIHDPDGNKVELMQLAPQSPQANA